MRQAAGLASASKEGYFGVWEARIGVKVLMRRQRVRIYWVDGAEVVQSWSN